MLLETVSFYLHAKLLDSGRLSKTTTEHMGDRNVGCIAGETLFIEQDVLADLHKDKPSKLLLLAQSRGMMGKYLLQSSLAHFLPWDEKWGSLGQITVCHKKTVQFLRLLDMESIQIIIDIITSIHFAANKIMNA